MVQEVVWSLKSYYLGSNPWFKSGKMNLPCVYNNFAVAKQWPWATNWIFLFFNPSSNKWNNVTYYNVTISLRFCSQRAHHNPWSIICAHQTVTKLFMFILSQFESSKTDLYPLINMNILHSRNRILFITHKDIVLFMFILISSSEIAFPAFCAQISLHSLNCRSNSISSL